MVIENIKRVIDWWGGTAVDLSPTVSGATFSVVGDSVGGAYTYAGSSQENNLNPVITGVTITGTVEEDEQITVTITVQNNTGYAISSADVKIYKASDQQATGEALSATIASGSISISGNQVTATYTLTEAGFCVLAQATVTLGNGANTTSDSARSTWTTTVAAADSPLDAFNELRFEFIGGSLTNQGSASNASVGIGTPAWISTVDGDGDVNYLDFNAGESDQLTITKTGSTPYTEPFTILMHVRMKAIMTEVLICMNASVRIRIDSGGDWQLNSTDVAATSAADADTNWHWIWATFNGANSKFQIDNQAELTLNNGSLADSGSLIRIGSSTSGSHASMKLKKLYMKSGAAITAQEKLDINAYLGI